MATGIGTMETLSYSAADLVVHMLALQEVEVIFGFPGDSSLPLYVSSRRHDRLRHVVARCQKCAGYMADAYARVTHKPGICDAPGGIGSTLLPPALNEAYNSSTPLVAITARTGRVRTGKWPTSHCNQSAMLAPLVKETITIEQARRIPEHIRNAFLAATSPRTGPVHVEIPSDLLKERVSIQTDDLFGLDHCCRYPSIRVGPDPHALEECLEMIERASWPVIYAGGGVTISDASDELEEFSRRWGVPVFTTVSGKGAVAEASYPLSAGVVGSKGHVLATRLFERADLVFLIGTKLGDKASSEWKLPPPDARVVQLDIDGREFGRNVAPDLVLAGDAKFVLRELNKLSNPVGSSGGVHPRSRETLEMIAAFRAKTRGFNRSLWAEQSMEGYTSIAEVVDALNEFTPDDTIVAVDAGPSSGWIGSLYATKKKGRRVLASRGSGSLGFGLPAAIGAKIARPGATVVGIGGDAGFAIASHELECAVRLGLGLTYIILNNQAMGMMSNAARSLCDEADAIPSFAPTNWADIATAYGCESLRITNRGRLRQALGGQTPSDRPLVLEIMTSPQEPPHDQVMSRLANEGMHGPTDP